MEKRRKYILNRQTAGKSGRHGSREQYRNSLNTSTTKTVCDKKLQVRKYRIDQLKMAEDAMRYT